MSQTLIFSGGGAFTLDDARYEGKSFSPGRGTMDTLNDIDFEVSGNRVFISDTSSRSVVQYNLSIPWDIETATSAKETTVSGSMSAQEADGMTLGTSGLSFYVVGQGKAQRYALTSAWSVSGATLAESVNSLASVSAATAVALSSDGLKMFISDRIPTNTIDEFALTSAWSISANSRLGSFNVTPNEQVYGIDFSDDGKTMFLLTESELVRQYALASAWSLGIVSFVQSFGVVDQTVVTKGGVVIADSGRRMYVTGVSAGIPNDPKIFQYSL